MAKKAAKEPTPPSPYEIFGTRIQKIISSPKAQKDKMAVLERLEGDNPEFWERLLEEISENDNVTIAYRDDGGVNVFWTVVEED
ncbi:DUF1654 domain-containing protein [Pseudomonas deceptionensis]|uniref:ATP-dependent hsl protease ATP-binding subunit hslU (ATP-bindingprotein lapA) n=1 Tax=Pseudomonas deceptionensis TaxID=882211 RepID=A0A0J6G9Y1_PSEDM|nr:DUF1654 domain-containing protein [Pseudomonas deceptionensis]KMM79183.1 hypothetical protein TR67_15725 [Pseudomonas deceptionensis]SEF04123.1 Protein of unknown function [Pseudomonas deceptionensis]